MLDDEYENLEKLAKNHLHYLSVFYLHVATMHFYSWVMTGRLTVSSE